ncbi:hypothetical protein Ahy_B03g061721 [Arachis hypogaea]|uniref:Uncharacterized protein n=1 Tax=Arachis hypogaea TaxID=3818 RepID=A0A444ZRY0_ARAHY|nr:hypothetical protein Ahy_B03g061721 [Arachis hypogaea]
MNLLLLQPCSAKKPLTSNFSIANSSGLPPSLSTFSAESVKPSTHNCYYRRSIRGCLRNELTVPRAIKTPTMVDTLQSAPLIDPSLRQRCQSVRACIIKHLPCTLIPIPPHNHINPQHFLPVGCPLVKVTYWHHWIPLRVPIKLLSLWFNFRLSLSSAEEHGFPKWWGCWFMRCWDVKK